MKYVYLAVFNLIAIYILASFVFGKGGVIDNVNKMNLITELQASQMEDQIEMEDMEARLSYLKSLAAPDPNLLAQNGRKFENTVIFKFDAPQDAPERLNTDWHGRIERLEYKIYLFIGIVAVMVVLGNGILIWNFKRAA